jgi:hypothetical protein
VHLQHFIALEIESYIRGNTLDESTTQQKVKRAYRETEIK